MHLPCFVFFETKGMWQWNASVVSASVTLFWTHKGFLLCSGSESLPSLQKRSEPDTTIIGATISVLCHKRRPILCGNFFLFHCPGMRYLSNCFQNNTIHNQSVGRISGLCGYCLLSENHLNSRAAIWDSSCYLDQNWNPPSLLFTGHRRSFLVKKRPEHDVNHSPPYTAEVRNEWSNTYTPPICLHGLNRDSSILTL